MWHARTQDVVRLSAELATLDARQYELDFKLRDAADRQRYSNNPEVVTQATADLTSILVEMERLMTRVRAIEAKLILLHQRARNSATPSQSAYADHRPNGSIDVASDRPERVAVEVFRVQDSHITKKPSVIAP